MNRHTAASFVTVVVSVTLSAIPALAQSGSTSFQTGATVVLTSAAPVFLQPDSTRVPLRTLPAGSSAAVERVQNGWVRITFSDPQYGPRTGWIEARFVKLDPTRPIRSPRAPVPSPDGVSKTQPPPPRPAPAARRGRPQPGLRVFGSVAVDRMAAAESFLAITGSETIPSYGGGVQGTNLWRGLFAEFALEYNRTDGERVFVFNREVFPLGIPLKIKTLPLDLVGGWRLPIGRVTPFGGGGATFMRYEEQSDFADAEENIREWHTGFVVLGGVEVRLIEQLHLRGDIRYRRLDDALGVGGVSQEFGETALGGVGGSIKVVFGR